LNRLARLG